RLDDQSVGSPRRRGGDRTDRRRLWKGAGGVDGAASGVEDGAWRLGSLRREGDQLDAALARVLRGLSARACRSAAPRELAEPRSARPALVLGLALVLQPRPGLHERPACLPAVAVSPRPRR